MEGWKRFSGLLREDLKSKLGMIVAVWYVLVMFCLLFSMKMTVPTGEMRSLYVGAGNTSFFAATIIIGIIMGAGTFRFLYSESKTDLYLGLPFTRNQLFAAGMINNFLIFTVPMVLCRLLFFSISLSMGYSEYESSVVSVWAGCVVLVLGFLFVMNLSLLAFLLAQNTGYRIGLLVLFLFGPGTGIRLWEKMQKALVPSFYRSELLEMLKGYLSPLTLLGNAAGIHEYADGAYWTLESHLSYLLYLAVASVVLFLINLGVFAIRPAERRGGMFTFRFAEYLVRYGCMTIAILWFVSGLQVFSSGGNSAVIMVIGVLIGVPAAHGLLNMIIAFDARKFLTGRWHLLAELLVMAVLLGGFGLWGKKGGDIPPKENVKSAAVVLTALRSGDDSDQILKNMQLTGEELSDTYDWLWTFSGENVGRETTYEVLAKYELQNGKTKYFKYQIPWYALDEFKKIYDRKSFKEGTYEVLRMDSLKYAEVQWTNGLESYTLDLDEEERQKFLEIYQQDLEKLTFEKICQQTPIGKLTFASTKNQGDVSAYIYPGFHKVLTYMSQLGIDADKKVSDYELTKIVVDSYMFTDGLLYDVRYLESEKIVTDSENMTSMSQTLFVEDFCVDSLLNAMNPDTEFTVYYRDSAGRTVNSVKCLAPAK